MQGEVVHPYLKLSIFWSFLKGFGTGNKEKKYFSIFPFSSSKPWNPDGISDMPKAQKNTASP